MIPALQDAIPVVCVICVGCDDDLPSKLLINKNFANLGISLRQIIIVCQNLHIPMRSSNSIELLIKFKVAFLII